MAYNRSYHRAYYLRNKEKIKAASKNRRTNDPHEYEDARLRRVFGISIDDYNEMFYQQEGVCAICKRPEQQPWRKGRSPKKLTVDHDHATGKVRGLLCQKCNSILGYAEDEPLRLIEAAHYLGRANGNDR